MRFLGSSNHENGAPRQEISNWSTGCSTFSRSGWSVVRSASLAKGGTSKKRPSPHLHEVLTRSNKVSPRTLQTALVCSSRTRTFTVINIKGWHWARSPPILTTYVLKIHPNVILQCSYPFC
jgi:hypothetical protein